MKTLNLVTIPVCLIFSLVPGLPQFNSGSTGADGPLIVTSNRTLTLPPNGIFHFTSITIAPDATLRFDRNLLNTPVYLLATGDVDVSGNIDVSGHAPTNFNSVGGLGGPGGFNGGYGGSALTPTPGDGLGPDGGRGNVGLGGFGTNYGNSLLAPLVGGSGGAGRAGSPGVGGSGGGGAILIAANQKITVHGNIWAEGGSFIPGACDSSGYGAGSGGAIRLVAPIVDGVGNLGASGGYWVYYYCPFRSSDLRRGNFGRVRIDCLDRDAMRNLNFAGNPYVTRGSQMFVFPPLVPKLDIIEAAGTAIPEGTGQLVTIELPPGSPTNQIVRVQGRNFTSDAPINVVVSPQNGPSQTFAGNLVVSSGNPPTVDINVTLPVGTVNHIHAWSR